MDTTDADIAAFLAHRDPSFGAPPGGGASLQSNLANRLVYLLGWGHLSANMVRWLAEGAIMDGLENLVLSSLAQAGQRGNYAGNVRRDMLRSLGRDSSMPKMPNVAIPIKDKGEVGEHKQNLINHFIDDGTFAPLLANISR